MAGKKRGRKQGKPRRIEEAAQEVTPAKAPEGADGQDVAATPASAPRPPPRTADATIDSFLCTPGTAARPAQRPRTISPIGPMQAIATVALTSPNPTGAGEESGGVRAATEAAGTVGRPAALALQMHPMDDIAPGPGIAGLCEAPAARSPTTSRFSDSIVVQEGGAASPGQGAGPGAPPSPLEVISARAPAAPVAMDTLPFAIPFVHDEEEMEMEDTAPAMPLAPARNAGPVQDSAAAAPAQAAAGLFSFLAPLQPPQQTEEIHALELSFNGAVGAAQQPSGGAPESESDDAGEGMHMEDGAFEAAVEAAEAHFAAVAEEDLPSMDHQDQAPQEEERDLLAMMTD